MVRTALAAVMIAGGTALSAEVTIGASKDNTLYDENLEASNGVGEWFFTGWTMIGFERRGLLAFDVAGAIPAGSTITSATLHLELITTGPNAGDIGLHKVLAAWGEGTSDGGDPGGQGTLATAGDATWDKRIYPGTAWATPGGDFVATASGSTTAPGVGPVTWNSTAGLVADVQSWLDNPSTNQGWLLKMPHVNQNAKRFSSRENASPAERPRLTIRFRPPCPVDLDDDGNVPDGLHPDGTVDINDLLAYLVLFEAGSIDGDLDNDGDPVADVPDGSTDINDLLFFLARFEAGC